MTNSNTDKKIGRKKAGTWGRTSGGYSPAAAKQSKRAGSKGARKVAKDDLRNIQTEGKGPHGQGDKYPGDFDSGPKVNFKSFMKKVKNFKNTETAAKIRKNKSTAGVTESYSDSKKNKYNLYSDKDDHHDAHNEIHKAVTHKSGNPKHMNAAMKKHAKHGASDTASREAIVGHFMKHHADKKGKTWSVKESSEAVSGKHLDSYLKQRELTGDQERLLKKKKLDPKKATRKQIRKADARGEIGEDNLQELSPKTLKSYIRTKVNKKGGLDGLSSKDHKGLARAGKQLYKKEYSKTGKPVKDKSGKVVGRVHDHDEIGEEKYPQSLLLKGDKDAAKKSKAERQDEKQRKLERAKHDTGGFRISDAEAAKAKARLTKEGLDEIAPDKAGIRFLAHQDKLKLKRDAEKLKKTKVKEGYEKGRGPTGIAFSIKAGHPDAENPETRRRYPERQTPEYKAKWKKKKTTMTNPSLREAGYHNTTGMDPSDADSPEGLEKERSARLKAMRKKKPVVHSTKKDKLVSLRTVKEEQIRIMRSLQSQKKR